MDAQKICFALERLTRLSFVGVENGSAERLVEVNGRPGQQDSGSAA
jgi:hypothetical protein